VAYASPPLPSSLYRPRKLPRSIRRQLPAVRIYVGIFVVGLLAVGVTWRKLANDRLTLDVGQQRSQIETLEKEIQQLTGQVEAESSYPRIARWARDQRGWWALPGHSDVVTLDAPTLPPAARREAEMLKGRPHG
jgi:hypothetical protein